jgi:hypothetical protein
MLYDEQRILTELDIRILITALADSVCCRCELPYRDHIKADHTFFDDRKDAPLQDCN